jgi:hypothetical protein
MEKIVVTRRNGPAWFFDKTDKGYFECKHKHTYRIMFDGCSAKPIWIGLVLDDAIVTAEAQIRAKRVVFPFGEYVFK